MPRTTALTDVPTIELVKELERRGVKHRSFNDTLIMISLKEARKGLTKAEVQARVEAFTGRKTA